MRILFLDLDTLRPDHLGCYGYHRNTSPNIDRIAAEGTRFTNYFCSDAPCLPSRAALMTGRHGIHTGVVGHGGTTADMRIEGESRDFRDRMSFENLPAVLRRAGFRTVSISPFAERHAAWWFYAGFNEMYNPGKGGMESAEEVTPTVMKWLQDNAKEDNWFLHINYWDAHTPYRAPEDFGNPFADEPLPEWLTEEVLQAHLKMVGPHKPLEIAMYDDREDPKYPRHPGKITDMDGLRKMIDGYDCGIRYLDTHVGRILDFLEEQGVLEDTAIIVTSDHGENMGELGIYGEHATADAATCRIPMIIKWPGAQRGHVDTDYHYNLDLLPTLCDIFDIPPSDCYDGQSYAPAFMSGKSCGRSELILSQCAHVCQRSVLFDSWLYIRTYHDGYHLFPKEMLFNLATDPHQQENLAAKHPEICNEAVRLLYAWHDQMMASMPGQEDPLWTVMREGGPYHARGQLKGYIEHLKRTGREWAIPELAERHPMN